MTPIKNETPRFQARRFFGIAAAVGAWGILLGVIGFVSFAYLLPQDLTCADEPYALMIAASFFGRVLAFHLGLLLAFLILPAMIFRKRWLAGCCIVTSLVLLFPTLISLRPHNPARASGVAFTLLSMNLKYADRDGNLIVRQIRDFDPAVLVIQDYTPYARSVLLKQIGSSYPHRFIPPNNLQGLAIFSRFGFVGGGPTISLTRTRRQLRVVLNAAGRSIVIYVEHPFSPRSIRRIVDNRLAMVDLLQQLQSETLPVIAAGDFNFTADTPNQAALQTAGLTDAFDLAGRGRGSTWPARPRWLQWFPGVRIDHIFIGPSLACTSFEQGTFDGSDHLPVIAGIAFR